MRDTTVVCSGSFSVSAQPATDEKGVAVASHIVVDSQGFAANPRGLGFVLGTLVGWYLDKVEKDFPQAATPLDRLLLMSDIHRGMAEAIASGERLGLSS